MITANKIRTYSVFKRKSKVSVLDFAKVPRKKLSFAGFYRSLPNILKAREIRLLTNAVIRAYRAKKPVIFMAGAHVIKCGLNPIIIELIKKRIITCVVLNGAGLIHDFEIALQGRTSEDVEENLKKGRFGMGKEPADFINRAVSQGVSDGLGMGEALARKMSRSRLPYKKLSLVCNAYKHKVPICAMVAIGTDIIHQHPSFDAGLTAQGSLRDFHLLVSNVCQLNNGGVVLSFGSAVILPEVFIKTLNLARNLGFKVNNFTSANFDMIYHYRPQQNLVLRPMMLGAEGYHIIGHHEIMLPLLAQAVIEKI